MKNLNDSFLFDKNISSTTEMVEIIFKGFDEIPWSEFILNPRRLRGSDFLMRWSQGVWSEHRLIDAINSSNEFFTIPYGPSGTAPHESIKEFELYFERLDSAGLGNIKRPDLLVFPIKYKDYIKDEVKKIGGISELPFIKEEFLKSILNKAILGVECENSLWKAVKMPDFNCELKPQKRLLGKPGLKKNAVLPTVIIKEEDREPLAKWQSQNTIPIHIWHVFYDRAYGLSFNNAENLIIEGLISPTIQIFQAPGGATTKKIIYKFYYHYAYSLGLSVQEPKLISACIEDKNGHILPYVKFEGGSIKITEECLNILRDLTK
ncbi:MAG: AccI family restriction endonuclease [Actinobacteria bacterium]|nr:AccI family restriction endonuclease [Actinomycetota bacterium]